MRGRRIQPRNGSLLLLGRDLTVPNMGDAWNVHMLWDFAQNPIGVRPFWSEHAYGVNFVADEQPLSIGQGHPGLPGAHLSEQRKIALAFRQLKIIELVGHSFGFHSLVFLSVHKLRACLRLSLN